MLMKLIKLEWSSTLFICTHFRFVYVMRSAALIPPALVQCSFSSVKVLSQQITKRWISLKDFCVCQSLKFDYALVLDFWWRLPWVSEPGWIPHLCAFSPACYGFLRFTWSNTADVLMSIAAKPFWSTCLQCTRIGETRTEDRVCGTEHGWHDTDWVTLVVTLSNSSIFS